MFQYHNDLDPNDLNDFEFSRPGKKKRIWFRIIIELAVLVLTIGCLYMLMTNKVDLSALLKLKKVKTTEQSITADTFYKSFLNSPTKTAELYGDQPIKITGRLMDEAKDGSYFVLGPVSGSRPDVGIKCFVKKSEIKRFKYMNLGTKVVVRGTFVTIKSGEITLKVSEFRAGN